MPPPMGSRRRRCRRWRSRCSAPGRRRRGPGRQGRRRRARSKRTSVSPCGRWRGSGCGDSATPNWPGPCGFLPGARAAARRGPSAAPRTRHATKTGPAWLFDGNVVGAGDRASASSPAGMLGASSRPSFAMPAPSARLSGKRLYIADLAARLEAMEDGGAPMNAVAYRLYARRMAAAMEGYPAGLLAAQLGRAYPSVLDAIESRSSKRTELSAARRQSARVVAMALLRHPSVSAVPPAEKRSPRRRDAVKGRSRPAPRRRRDDRRVVDADDQASALRWPSSTSRNLRKSTGFVR